MILPYKNIKLSLEFYSEFNPEKKSILFLHGFTGSANEWKDAAQKTDPAYNKIALDLIGHGKSSSPPETGYYKTEELVNQINFAIEYLKIDKIILCGYSMGGRAALVFAAAHPGKIRALILESTSAGIESESERKIRADSDEQLAEFIESHSIEEFVKFWLDKELFHSLKHQPENKFQKLKHSKMKNSRSGLANSLRGFGTAVMPYLGNEIKQMSFPVLLISGRLDTKFTQSNCDLANKFPNAKHIIIESAGHNVHYEDPDGYAASVNQFLKQF